MRSGIQLMTSDFLQTTIFSKPVLLIVLGLSGWRALALPKIAAFGDLQGQVESCGCAPSTDLGGVRRIVRQIDELKREPGMFVVSLGDNYSPEPEHKLRNDFISASMKIAALDVSLLGGREFRLEMYKDNNLEYLWSNAPKGFEKQHQNISRVWQSKNAHFWGFSEASDGYSWNAEFSEFLKKNVDPKVDNILLFSGSQKDLRVALNLGVFDLVISSNEAIVVDSYRAQPVTELLRHSEPPVYMVPSHGRGIILFGKGATIASLFEPLESRGWSAASAVPSATPEIIWLRPSSEPSRADSLYVKYQRDLQASFEKIANTHSLAGQWLGAAACQGCHPAEYATWRNSRHAKAFETLLGKNKHFDSECLGCHTVGHLKGGYHSQSKTSHLSGVQCENCHGPRKEHITNPSLRSKGWEPAREACVGCHENKHSPDFDLSRYWTKIAHGAK